MTTPLRVLLIEDDPDDAALVVRGLTRAGYSVEFRRVDDEASMRDAVTRERWDVAVADHSMPRFSSTAALSVLRDLGVDLPFLIVSGSIPEDLAVSSMKAGAHDFIPKDRLARLVPAVQREVREAANRARRRDVETRLVESEARYRRFFEADLTGAVLADRDGRIMDCNPAFLRMAGFDSVSDAIGTRLADLWSDPGDFDRLVLRATQQRTVEDLEGEIRRRDRRSVYVVSNVMAEFERTGELAGIRAYFIDVTERRHAEENLRQAQKLEAVARLAGGIAHDFNNLLCAIGGYVDLALTESGEGTATSGYLLESRKAADRASLLTRRLLAFSRRQIVQPEVLDVPAVVADVEGLVRRLLREDIDFQVTLDADTGAILADRGQIEQVVMNLVVNARDAIASRGRISVRSRRVSAKDGSALDADLPEGDHVLLSVRDDGEGMPADVVARLFEPFFTTKAAGEGTGLGLATVRSILDLTQGTVRVSTEPGKGSEFRVYWPRLDPQLAAALPAEKAAPSERRSGTILVVEDDALVRGVVTEMLRRRGYAVLEAADGIQALEVASRHVGPIEALVSDVVMPGMRGPEVAEEIRRVRPEIGVLFLSGYADDPATQGVVSRLGAVFLPKPFRAEDFLAKLEEVLRRNNGP